MAYEFYITPSDYLVAERNGIAKGTLERRIRDLAWTMQRATTERPQKRMNIQPWKILAEQNGIKYATLRRRIFVGWEPLRAATEPLVNRHKAMVKVGQANRIYPMQQIEAAIQNGVRYETFRGRIKQSKWNVNDAMTIPTMSRGDIGRIMKDGYGRATRQVREKYKKEVTA